MKNIKYVWGVLGSIALILAIIVLGYGIFYLQEKSAGVKE